MLLVLNRWNRNWYEVIEVTDSSVTLKRKDGSQFTIAKKELYANYANIQGNPESKILEK